MKIFYALVLGLVLLPACRHKKKETIVEEEYDYTEERISGVENALDLK